MTQSYIEKQAEFNRVRALILKIVRAQPGLTVEEISKQFLLAHGFLPRVDNRLREARKLGWVVSREEDGRLRWYTKTSSDFSKRARELSNHLARISNHTLTTWNGGKQRGRLAQPGTRTVSGKLAECVKPGRQCADRFAGEFPRVLCLRDVPCWVKKEPKP